MRVVDLECLGAWDCTSWLGGRDGGLNVHVEAKWPANGSPAIQRFITVATSSTCNET